jgi:hypothetical protein
MERKFTLIKELINDYEGNYSIRTRMTGLLHIWVDHPYTGKNKLLTKA